MVRENEIRSAERAVEWRDATDAGLLFIGRIRTPWTSRMKCPRQGRADGPTCRIEVFPPWTEALAGITDYVGDGEDFVVLRHPIVCTLHSTAGPSRLTAFGAPDAAYPPYRQAISARHRYVCSDIATVIFQWIYPTCVNSRKMGARSTEARRDWIDDKLARGILPPKGG